MQRRVENAPLERLQSVVNPMGELAFDSEIAAALRNAKTIAVLGAHDHPAKPAHYVPEYLHSQGYRVVPVNPQLVGRTLWGETVRATLAELNEAVDIVDVFRRAEALFQHLDDLTLMAPRPKLVWLQQGIRNDVFSAKVMALGIDIVQDRCTLADHRRLNIGPRSAAV